MTHARILPPLIITLVMMGLMIYLGPPMMSVEYCPGSARFSCPGFAINENANWAGWGIVGAAVALLMLAGWWHDERSQNTP